MNLRDYYANVRNTLATIEHPFVVLVSHVTADGGKAGVMTLAKRDVAARLLVQGRARLAKEDEVVTYHLEEKAKKDRADSERRLNTIHLDFNTSQVLDQFCPIPAKSVPPVKPKPLK